MSNAYQTPYLDIPVSQLDVDARARFITRTYLHLLGAIAAFIGIEIFLFQSGMAEGIARTLGGNWLLVMGGFILVSWGASHFAFNARNKGVQYLALAGFTVAEAIIFVPMLYIAQAIAPGVIQSAAVITILGFAALTAIVLITKKDFSFMRGILMWAGIVALVAIVASLIFGFHLGTWFSVAMIALAGGSILYDTSNVLHHYPEDRYVGASLSLFASVALLFWYVLRLLISLRE